MPARLKIRITELEYQNLLELLTIQNCHKGLEKEQKFCILMPKAGQLIK
jgi:hypothetical protein